MHRDVADAFLPRALAALKEAGVTIHGDDRFALHATGTGVGFAPVTDEDWAEEYYSLDIAAGIVDSLDDALAHIRRWSSGHTEAIVTDSQTAARQFVAGVDSAAVMVNASTRFTDGGEFGFGAEIGISTQKLHARGPMGLTELTTSTYVVTGDGHIRGYAAPLGTTVARSTCQPAGGLRWESSAPLSSSRTRKPPPRPAMSTRSSSARSRSSRSGSARVHHDDQGRRLTAW